MKEYLKSEIKHIPLILILFILFYGITTLATTTLFNSNEVKYNNTTSGIQSDKVQGAIDELYACASNYGAYNTRLTNTENKIGSGSLTTTSNTLIGGVNELNSKITAKVFDNNIADEYLALTAPDKTAVTHYHVVEQGNLVTIIGRIAITGQIASGGQVIVRGYPKPKYNVYCSHNNLDFSLMITERGELATGSNFPGKSSGNFIYSATYYSDNLW